MKKIVCLLLAAMLILSAGTALGELQRVSEEPVSFTFWAAYNPTYQLNWENIKFWQYYEEVTGVHINWVLFANSGEMKEKLQMLFASNNTASFPDAFFRCGISDSQLKKYGPEGLFLDVYDLVKEYAPNLCARLDETSGWGQILDPGTGAMYSIPQIKAKGANSMNPMIFLNTKMMENIGETKMPTTTDELIALLCKVRDEDANGNGDKGDEVGLVSNALNRYINAFTGAFGINNRGWSTQMADADPDDPTKVRFIYTCDQYREFLRFMRQLYAEKLVDQDLFSASTAKMVAMGSQDMIFGLLYLNMSAASVPDPSVYKALPGPLTGPQGYSEYNGVYGTIGKGNFVVSPTCKTPELLVKWVDGLYTEEGARMLFFGKEGVDYYVNEKGEPTFTDEVMAKVTPENSYDMVVSSISPYGSGGLPAYYEQTNFCGAECRGEPVVFVENVKDALPPEVWSFNFTSEESTEVSALEADIITNCHDVYRAKFITGELDIDDDAVWDKYVAEMEKLGLEDLIWYYQTAVDRMAAAAQK